MSSLARETTCPAPDGPCGCALDGRYPPMGQSRTQISSGPQGRGNAAGDALSIHLHERLAPMPEGCVSRQHVVYGAGDPQGALRLELPASIERDPAEIRGPLDGPRAPAGDVLGGGEVVSLAPVAPPVRGDEVLEAVVRVPGPRDEVVDVVIVRQAIFAVEAAIVLEVPQRVPHRRQGDPLGAEQELLQPRLVQVLRPKTTPASTSRSARAPRPQQPCRCALRRHPSSGRRRPRSHARA